MTGGGCAATIGLETKIGRDGASIRVANRADSEPDEVRAGGSDDAEDPSRAGGAKRLMPWVTSPGCVTR